MKNIHSIGCRKAAELQALAERAERVYPSSVDLQAKWITAIRWLGNKWLLGGRDLKTNPVGWRALPDTEEAA